MAGIVGSVLGASGIESETFVAELLRALRQGIYFGVETRIPYAVTSVLRPILFGKPSRPLLGSLKFFGDQTLKHGWVIARISVLYKAVERALGIATGCKAPEQWHSFVAGCTVGYVVMARDKADASLKKQINMAIGVRTIYALGAYVMRQQWIPSALGLTHDKVGYSNGQTLWYTLMWGVVMWHWRHQTAVAPGEMNPSQISQMNFIYNAGDSPGIDKWFSNNYMLWLLALGALKLVPNSRNSD